MKMVTEWVALAAELAAEMQGQDPAEQRRRIAACAERCGLKPDTMRRMVRAYEYALVRIRSENMPISDVTGGFIAVEALERLSRTSPEVAAGIARAVLQGECGYREVVRLSRGVASANQEAAPKSNNFDWQAFSWSLYEELYGSSPGYFSARWTGSVYSNMAKRLKVDIEFDIEDLQRAVFLAPSFSISEGHGRPLDDHLARAFMSLAFYVETVFVTATQDEERNAKYFLDHCSQNFHRKILKQFTLYRYDFGTKALSQAWRGVGKGR